MSGFHQLSDSTAVSLSSRPDLVSVKVSGANQTGPSGRTLSYRFYPHFHPYVTHLVNRLIEQSVSGLQGEDTKYTENADGTLETQPDSTIVSLVNNTTAKSANGDAHNILAGTRITLPDGVSVTLDQGGTTTLPGKMILHRPRGMQVQIGNSKRSIEFGAKLKLVQGTSVTLPDEIPVTLPAGTLLWLIGCKPKPVLYQSIFSEINYAPSELVQRPYPAKDLDFTSSGAYAVYNWELFYHVPVTMAIQLSKNQRFEEAQKWFHYIFDPTDDSGGPTPERFWKVKPFQYTDVRKIEEILVNLSTGADPALRNDTINSIGAWKDFPFGPHVVARYRQTAYMFKTVMAYLDNLVDWGDSSFRQDTGESINEAMQIYVLAANILGPRPQAVPKKGSVRPQTYANLKKDLDAFGNTLVEIEPYIPFDLTPHPPDTSNAAPLNILGSIGKALYFCVPRNDKLLSYWDTVADRLFKIRNSLNIQGIFRQLPLFEPPIDPGLLAKAAAAGLDVGAIIGGLNQPLPLVRFQLLVQKAAEICQEVKSLGNNLLSAIEKEDNEVLAILRATHERDILERVETVKYSQLQEAIKNREGLEQSLTNAVKRYTYYERQLGKNESDIKISELDALDTAALLNNKGFKASEPEVAPRDIEVDIAVDLSGEGGGKKMNTQEVEELTKLKAALDKRKTAATIHKGGAALAYIPEIDTNIQPFGTGSSLTFGGSHLSNAERFIACFYDADADELSYEANRASKIGSYARREQEWAFQSNVAAGEITQLFKQLRAAQIREAIAEREWNNHRQQIKNAKEVERFLNGETTPVGDKKHKKTSTQDFYTWIKREVRSLYGQCFQFAFDIAKKAERALQHELGNPELSYLQFGYQSGKEGLLAGEKLYLDIKRMEMAYHDLNQREYELTKHVSLLQVNPLALIQLRANGRCTVSVPEELFDMDCPGHYFRRIKTIAVSIPCVAGPYSTVSCTVTLLKSSIRKSSLVSDDGYARTDADDSRFSDFFGSMQSIVTSTGQNDNGLFETNLRDERILPFELSGVISEWQLELPSEMRQFDYDTISDVILHLRYTAREGGSLLRNAAVANLKTRIDEAQAAGSVRLFSLRHEFPTAWAKFKNIKITGATNSAELTLELRQEHFPFWSQDSLEAVKRTDLFGKPAKNTKGTIEVSYKDPPSGTKDNLVKDRSLNDLRAGKLSNFPVVTPLGKFTLSLNDNSMENLWLALAWGKQ
jgi:Tc toxin complex TcA C-terminal TcB-binding domain